MKASFTEEVLRNISLSLKDYYKTHRSSWTGRKHKEESKKKMRNTFQKNKHQQGCKNSHYGCIWVYNKDLDISKSINKNELENYIKLGYVKGRKIKWKKFGSMAE